MSISDPRGMSLRYEFHQMHGVTPGTPLLRMIGYPDICAWDTTISRRKHALAILQNVAIKGDRHGLGWDTERHNEHLIKIEGLTAMRARQRYVYVLICL
ncbi:hypothetical protein KIPB_012740 [Kipferlia bialata]|uniref:Uncharacterized protein n=1 Tax=Kipferlia bialata TaxID=797122 RepID=A0A9K3GPR8_9EUKA|nr:hypothetical protein KIPB_012740 [Kipferlia bialata]|eukprot:g12740.t1